MMETNNNKLSDRDLPLNLELSSKADNRYSYSLTDRDSGRRRLEYDRDAHLDILTSVGN